MSRERSRRQIGDLQMVFQNPNDTLNPPAGCPFATRCRRKIGAICDDEPPPYREAADRHVIACRIPLDDLRAVEPVFQIAEPT